MDRTGRAGQGAGPSNFDPDKIAPEYRLANIPELVGVAKEGHNDEIWYVAISPDGKLMSSGGRETLLRVWDMTGPQPTIRGTIRGNNGGSADRSAFSPDSRRLAFCCRRQLVLLDVTEPAPRLLGEVQSSGPNFYSTAFSPDGKILAAAEGNEVRFWDITGPQLVPLEQKLVGHSGKVTRVTYRADGKVMATSGWDRTVRLWDVSGRLPTELARLDGPEPFWSAALSPTESKVAGACANGTVTVWDYAQLPPRQCWSQKGHRQWVAEVNFFPDGKRLVSSEGGLSNAGPLKAIIWNAVDGSQLREWELPERAAGNAVASDGIHLALGSHNRNIYVLRLPSK